MTAHKRFCDYEIAKAKRYIPRFSGKNKATNNCGVKLVNKSKAVLARELLALM